MSLTANLLELKGSILVNKCVGHIYTVWLNLFCITILKQVKTQYFPRYRTN